MQPKPHLLKNYLCLGADKMNKIEQPWSTIRFRRGSWDLLFADNIILISDIRTEYIETNIRSVVFRLQDDSIHG